MIELLTDDRVWDKFLQKKLDNPFLSKYEKEEFNDFIINRKYKDICDGIAKGSYSFSIPKKSEISKKYTDKKRVVYQLEYNEMMVLKLLSTLLYEYDSLFADNLYSFRKNTSVKHAICNFINIKNIKNMYGYKLDISNYFNSINKDILFDDLEMNLNSDVLYIFKDILNNPKVCFKNEIIEEDKGAMAGIPIAGFFANYYIRELDWYFIDKSVLYMRYSDDIILFTNTKEERDEYANYINTFLYNKKLTLNEKKMKYIEPHEPFEFLGFSFDENKIDVSLNAVKKIKASIHHNAKMLIKWGKNKKVDSYKLLKVMNRKYNQKFFGKMSEELSWMYWYFPFINTVDSLKIVDKYLQDTERYMITNKHNKANYRACSYAMLKEYGYKSLVHEYYKFKENIEEEKSQA